MEYFGNMISLLKLAPVLSVSEDRQIIENNSKGESQKLPES